MRGSALLALITAIICVGQACGVRIYKSRQNAMASLSGVTKESQQYFGSCEQSNKAQACVLAIDGDPSLEWPQCAEAYPDAAGQPAWWKGYLENPIYVVTVYIQGAEMRVLGQPNGLMHFSISGSGHVCYTHLEQNPTFTSKTFPCDVLADIIEIRSSIADGVLGLCEVQVQGAALKFPTVLAPRGLPLKFLECDQSSTHGTRHCWNAFDLKTEQLNLNLCAMTGAGSKQWWRALFKVAALVQEVVIYNRKDGGQDQLTNFEINIGKRLCVRYNSPDKFDQKSFPCNHFGGDIEIFQRSAHALTLCEVKVIGHEVEMQVEKKRTPLGCFASVENEPPLGADFAEPVSFTVVHEEKCDRMCRRLKTKYFGLHDGYECWCGNDYGKAGKADDAKCKLECPGNKNMFCGGDSHTAVFEIL